MDIRGSGSIFGTVLWVYLRTIYDVIDNLNGCTPLHASMGINNETNHTRGQHI